MKRSELRKIIREELQNEGWFGDDKLKQFAETFVNIWQTLRHIQSPKEAYKKAESYAKKYHNSLPGLLPIFVRMAGTVQNIDKLSETVMPKGVLQQKIKLQKMSDKDLADYFKQHAAQFHKPIEQIAREFAWRHGYGKMSDKYWSRIKNLV